jgi:ABC-2 type transport system ATP-binding protein
MAAEGRAILVSSHLMGEVQDVADHVVVVGRGRVLADANVNQLVARASGDEIVIRTPAAAEAVTALQRAGAAATVTDGDTLSVTGLEAQRVVEVLGQAHVRFSEVTAQRATLEDVYLQLTSGEAEFRAGSDREAQQ